MTYQRNQQDVAIANVSRRNMLKGIAGTGVFVLAAQFPAIRPAMAYATGAEKMPHGVVTNPHIFVSIGTDGRLVEVGFNDAKTFWTEFAASTTQPSTTRP